MLGCLQSLLSRFCLNLQENTSHLYVLQVLIMANSGCSQKSPDGISGKKRQRSGTIIIIHGKGCDLKITGTGCHWKAAF